MGYTPERQILSGSIDDLVNAMDDLDERLRARIDDPSEWKEDHLDELAGLSAQLVRLRAQLRVLQNGTP